MFKKQLKGGALYLAVFLSLLISILLSLLILVSYYSTLDFEKFIIQQKVYENAQSALNICLGNTTDLNEDTPPAIIDLYGTGEDSVNFYKSWWGGYQVAAVKSFRKNYSASYTCLIGVALPSDTSLITKESSKPLSLAGKTNLTDKCLLPKAGLKRAYVEGQNFIGDKLVNGTILFAPSEIPEPDKNWLEYIERILDKSVAPRDSILDLETFLAKDSLQNSFLNRTICIYSQGVIILSGKIIKGNIKIVGTKKIIIENSCIIQDALLIAPKIEIKSEFSGCLQAIATDTIKVEKEVNLTYPSSLIVYDKKPITSKDTLPVTPSILLDEKVKCSGSLVALSKNDQANTSNSFIKISKDCEINGVIYSKGYTDIQGTLHGTLITSAFILITPSAVYENHLLNAEISRSKLSNYFSGALVLKGNTRKRIAKWLN